MNRRRLHLVEAHAVVNLARFVDRKDVLLADNFRLPEGRTDLLFVVVKAHEWGLLDAPLLALLVRLALQDAVLELCSLFKIDWLRSGQGHSIDLNCHLPDRLAFIRNPVL